MPIPYRKTPRAAEIGLAAYIDILWEPENRTFYGGLLLIDGKGQPQEFVHNVLSAPSGLGWTEEKIQYTGISTLTHSLFDACRREPHLIVSLSTLGSPEYCNNEIAPAIPFAQVILPKEGMPAEWNWINTTPSSGMRASIIAEELIKRGLIAEPFERLREALKIVYPTLKT